MAELNKPGVQGSGFGRFMRELVDRGLFANRAYNYRYGGGFDPKGVRQGLIQSGAGLIAPGAGTLAGLALNMYNRAGMNNTRRNVPNPNLGKPTSGMYTPGGNAPSGLAGSYGFGSFGGGLYSGGGTSPGNVPGGPISTVPLTPQPNFQVTNPGINTNGMNLNAFPSGPTGGFSGNYSPWGANVIEGDAAQDMWRGMQMGIYGNRQSNNYAQ